MIGAAGDRCGWVDRTDLKCKNVAHRFRPAILLEAELRVPQIGMRNVVKSEKIIERGRLKDGWGATYFIEIDEFGKRHKYVVGLGFFGEIDELTGEFNSIDFTPPYF